MRSTASIGDFFASAIVSYTRRLADRDVRIDERGVGDDDHDVGVGDEVQTAARAHAVDRGDHRFPHVVVPRR